MSNRLEALTVIGDDLVTLLMNVVIEITMAVLPNDKQADEALIEIANRLQGLSSRTTNNRLSLLAGSLAANLIATEESP
jgi:hypothetical protein